MKFTSVLVLAAIALTSMQSVQATPSTGNLRGLSSVSDVLPAKVTSISATRAKEQVLSAVNAALNDVKKIDASQLISIAKRIVTKDASLATADAYTKKVVEAVHSALGKLFPGESEIDIFLRVLPLLIKRQLEPIKSLTFGDENRVTSLNGIVAGEQLLAAVNKIVSNVDGDLLIRVARLMESSDALSKADEATKKIGAALSQAIGKLFPGEKVVDVIKRLLPLIPGH